VGMEAKNLWGPGAKFPEAGRNLQTEVGNFMLSVDSVEFRSI
jgi:hypothetical protein